MFYQVIRNLVTNAIKFSPREQGSVVVTISASTSTRDVDISDITIPTALALVGSLRIDVKDNGAGISLENQRRVFGEFAQFDKKKLQGGGGSGLGLWISRRIMNLHGGLLSFTSEGVGKGSTFFICVPVFERKVVESQDVNSLAKLSSKVFPAFEENVSIVLDIESGRVPNESFSFRSEARRLKVLIVDDSAVNRKINKKLCAECIPDATFHDADDGDLAVMMIAASIDEGVPFDLVLMDSNMNNMHGPQAAATLRKDYKFKGMIIGVTGNALPEDVSNFVEHGANYVLTKPLNSGKLESILKGE
jgi:CheY-like chemotaxis protein